jgi:hypothetical protein
MRAKARESPKHESQTSESDTSAAVIALEQFDKRLLETTCA